MRLRNGVGCFFGPWQGRCVCCCTECGLSVDSMVFLVYLRIYPPSPNSDHMHGKPDLKAAVLSAQLSFSSSTSWRRTRYGKTQRIATRHPSPRTYTQKTKKPTENLPKHAKSQKKK